MQTLSAKEAKYGFGRLIDLARAEPVAAAVAKHGRPVVVVLAIEEYERLKALDVPSRIVFWRRWPRLAATRRPMTWSSRALIDGGAIKNSVLRSE